MNKYNTGHFGRDMGSGLLDPWLATPLQVVRTF